MSASETHNRLAREFVMKLVKEVLDEGGGAAAIMVVLESIIFSVMLTNSRVLGITDSVAVEMVDSAVHRATERFVNRK